MTHFDFVLNKLIRIIVFKNLKSILLPNIEYNFQNRKVACLEKKSIKFPFHLIYSVSFILLSGYSGRYHSQFI